MMKLLYISYGNIPSKWAHTFQVMKMAEAFAKQVEGFGLVTRAHWTAYLKPHFDYFGWYGIQRPFRIIRKPVPWRQSSPILAGYSFPRFNRLAALYAWITRQDVVYTRTPHTARLTVQLGLPTILETHIDTRDLDLRHLVDIKEHPRLLGVVTISEVLCDMYADLGVPREKIMVALDAVDLERFHVSETPAELRRRLNLPLEEPIITYSGHLYPHKGVGTVIECAKQLPEHHFALVGGWEGDILNCKRQAQDLENVFFAGFVPNKEVPKYLLASDILVLPNSAHHPSAQYTSPMKLFEYMAAQKPIIASDLPALRTVLRHGENAWLVEPDNASALASAIRRLLEDGELAQRLARQAHQDVQTHTWDRRAAAILDRFVPSYKRPDDETGPRRPCE